MVCLDTDFLIAYLQDDPEAIKKLEQQTREKDAAACTTVINAFELYKGAYRLKEKQKEVQKIKWLLDSLELLTLDHDSARMAGELDAATKSNTIGESDLLIAGIVFTNDETLITRNLKHFERIPNLNVESW